MAKLAERALETLQHDRFNAIKMVQDIGLKRTQVLLEDASRDLEKRIAQKVKGLPDNSFTLVQMRATLAQVKNVLVDVKSGLKRIIVDSGKKASEASTEHTVQYLRRADKAFRGVGEQRLALHEASMFERAAHGVESSILRRLASSGEPIKGADEKPHRAKIGILERYGMETIKHFEKILKLGVIVRKPLRLIENEIAAASPFLRQAPAYWATRIVRTETMGAYNRAGWHSIREADDQLGDMTKILSATFDDRTAADSYAVHGQIRRPEEPFESWFGLYQHPPNRPNDREIVVPHRISWQIPDYLQQLPDDAVAARWHFEGHKQPMPERPLMTTIDLSLFGHSPRSLPRGSEEVDEGKDD